MFNREPFSLLSPRPSPRVRARRPRNPIAAPSSRRRQRRRRRRRRRRDARADPSSTHSRPPIRPAHFDTTVITAGTLAGSTVGYSVGVRRLWLGLVFFGRVSRCPLVAFFLACLAARTVNVIGAPIVAKPMMRGRPRARACVCERAAGSTAGTRPPSRARARAWTLALVVTALEHYRGTSRYDWSSSIKNTARLDDESRPVESHASPLARVQRGTPDRAVCRFVVLSFCRFLPIGPTFRRSDIDVDIDSIDRSIESHRSTRIHRSIDIDSHRSIDIDSHPSIDIDSPPSRPFG